MNYELAKELKDAGFPYDWGEQPLYEGGELGHVFYNHPTLEDLIEACGEGFECLYRLNDTTWQATRADLGQGDYTPFDLMVWETPQEAVARLWLALKT